MAKHTAFQNTSIVEEMQKLIRLTGDGRPTTHANLERDAGKTRFLSLMSWDSNGQLKIK